MASLGPDSIHESIPYTLGRIKHSQGKYLEAGLLIQRAIDLADKRSDRGNVEDYLNALGDVAFDEGRYEDAEDIYNKSYAQRLARCGPDYWSISENLNSFRRLCLIRGEPAKAESLLHRSLELREGYFGPDHPYMYYNRINLGNLYRAQRKYAQADSLYELAIMCTEKSCVPNHPHIGNILNNRGNLYYKMGHYSKAESYYMRALEISETVLGPYHPQVAECLSNLAMLHRDWAKLEDARALGRRALAIRRQNLRDGFEVLTERNALLFSEFLKNEASNYLSILFGYRDASPIRDREIADVIFTTKGQVSDGIFARQSAFFSAEESSLRPIADSLQSAPERLAYLYIRSFDEKQVEHYLEELTEASAAKETLESELARRSARFQRELEIWDVNTSKIIQSLPSGSALIEYLKYDHLRTGGEIEPRYLAVVLNGRRKVFVCELGPAAPIDSTVYWYRWHFRHSEAMDKTGYEKISEAIYSKIWAPISREIAPAELIFISPDGALNLISFAGLIDNEGKYLIEKYPLHYLSTGRDLLRLKERQPSGTGLLAFGDPDYDAPISERTSARLTLGLTSSPQFPSKVKRNIRLSLKELTDIKVPRLPGSRREVELIIKEWQHLSEEPAWAYYGPEASEDIFIRQAPGRKIIHLATHGYYLDQEELKGVSREIMRQLQTFVGKNPLLLSGLLLAGANVHSEGVDSLEIEDGILTAEEVAGMNLTGTEPVVLSACETGLGEVKTGEGVYGLRRAFQMAGAETVVSALWEVSDEDTAELMRKLYASRSEDIARIMQEVSVEQIRDLRDMDQSDYLVSWAAFIAMRDWRLD